jgi:8-oxo-dGTP pyrophosphatase MutT (NUDIX family)
MREKEIHKTETHVGCIVFDGNEILALKRAPSRELFPNNWTTGGGQVKPGESFEDAAIRKMKEEAGIVVEPITSIGTYEFNTSDGKVPGIYLVCEFIDYVNSDLKQPQLNSEEHTEAKWISEEEIQNHDFIPNLKENLPSAFEVYYAMDDELEDIS